MKILGKYLQNKIKVERIIVRPIEIQKKLSEHKTLFQKVLKRRIGE
jgi:hypothetical protein